MYIYIYIYVYVYITCVPRRSQRLLYIVRLCIKDIATTPCRSMPCCGKREIIKTLGRLYVSFGLMFLLILNQVLVSVAFTAQ